MHKQSVLRELNCQKTQAEEKVGHPDCVPLTLKFYTLNCLQFMDLQNTLLGVRIGTSSGNTRL